MNYFNKKNLVILIIAVLLIVNIATIGTIVYLSYHKPKMPDGPQPRESFNQIKKRLDFTEDQEKTFRALQGEYRDQSKEIMRRLHEVRIRMMDEFSKPDADSSTLYDLAEETGALHKELKTLTIHHMLEMKSVCNEDQFKFIEGMFRRRMMDDERRFRPNFERKRKYRNRPEHRRPKTEEVKPETKEN